MLHSVQCLHGEGGRSDASELFYSPCVSQSTKVVEDRRQLGRVVDEKYWCVVALCGHVMFYWCAPRQCELNGIAAAAVVFRV